MRLCGCYQVFPLDASDDFTTRHSTHSRDPHHHISGTSVATHVTCHTPMSRLSCSPLTSELGPGPGHRQPLARADRCPADSLTLPRLTPGVTSLRPPGPGRGNLCLLGPHSSPPLHRWPGLCCVWLLPPNELQCWAQADRCCMVQVFGSWLFKHSLAHKI